MTRLFDLLFSYSLVGTGFVVFGTLFHAWVFPDRVAGGSLRGLVVISFALGLLGAVMVVIGLHWHRAATAEPSLPGPRTL